MNAEARANEEAQEAISELGEVGIPATVDDANWVDRLLEVIGAISPDALSD